MSDDDKPATQTGPFATSLSKAGEQYAKYTANVSTVSRTLAIAGLGLVWLYANTGSDNPTKLSVSLMALAGQWWMVAALIAFVMALFADISHYAYGAWRWQAYEYRAAVILQFDDFGTQFPTAEVRKAWRSGVGLDIANFISFTASRAANSPLLTSEPRGHDYKVASARAILRAVTSEEPNAPPLEGLNESELAHMKSQLASAWAPPVIADRLNKVFWLKVLLTLVGYASILVSVAIDLWPHLSITMPRFCD